MLFITVIKRKPSPLSCIGSSNVRTMFTNSKSVLYITDTAKTTSSRNFTYVTIHLKKNAKLTPSEKAFEDARTNEKTMTSHPGLAVDHEEDNKLKPGELFGYANKSHSPYKSTTCDPHQLKTESGSYAITYNKKYKLTSKNYDVKPATSKETEELKTLYDKNTKTYDENE